jgi:DNA helicase II / ATP-dependent DNA helicase PcrA
VPVDPIASFGRGAIIADGRPVPDGWAGAGLVTVDAATLESPQPVVERLHGCWAARHPVVVRLAVDPGSFRVPPSITGEPWNHSPRTEPWFDRLHFLVWANNYDCRGEAAPVWWWARKASRLLPGSAVVDRGSGASSAASGDVLLADGTLAWIDGGPRQPWDPVAIGSVIHAESVEAGRPAVQTAPVPPDAELAVDQLRAVGHERGPARVIAPAGSGKTRVLTERLRHLIVDRGYEPATVVAVAYNKEAERELTARTAAFAPHVRTLNSLGLWVLREHRGRQPPVIDEREVRKLVDSLLPGHRRRRANVDPIGPYLEGLAAVRLGLRDPEKVEDSRDDVDGLGELFPRFRDAMRDRGVVDFDEQIYAAIETILADGPFRAEMQRRCRHVLVDEFQDLTPAHVLLIRLLSLPALDVFGVGDDDQCIYGHAGADPGFLIDYRALFPGAGEHALTVNYRCPIEVVAAAATLLGYNERRVAKEIVAGPDNEAGAGTLRVVEHEPDGGAEAVVGVVGGWLAEAGVEPASIAVLARVNSILLAPHVALRAAGIALNSVVTPDVLGRTGLRAALAYLRIAASPDGFAAGDVVEILRRPSRGLPPWFSERISRRRSWTVGAIETLASNVPDKDLPKVLDLAEDLRLVVDAGRFGSTRSVLEVVRDVVGLGSAMSLLDRSGGGQGASHLDDLDGLITVADLHPDATTFEAWLRDAIQAERNPQGVTVSTIHRVKGREWDRVAVFGVVNGITPHRLADDIEEERRVLHVGVTRGRRRVALLADKSRRSPFIDELHGVAPTRAIVPIAIPDAARRRPSRHEATQDDVELSVAAIAAEKALRDWRTMRAKADEVPAYVVLNDRHLRGIAVAKPSSATELAACDGIGPTKLERYGDEILDVLSSL